MRVLVYIEPHPIRNSHTHFRDVAKSFLPLLKDATPDLDIRMYATDAVVATFGDAITPVVRQRLLRATAAEQTVFESQLLDWESEGIAAWVDLMAGGPASDTYMDVLRRIWAAFPFDVIIHWGENGAITRFLSERPVTRIAMELGASRPPFVSTVVTDPFGTNGNAIVPKLSVEDLRTIVDNHSMTAAEALYAHSASMDAAPYSQRFAPLAGDDLTGRILGAQGKIAFLPLQLHDDANLLRFSNYSTVEEVVLDVVPKLAAAGYLTIIKTHPGSKHRPQSRAAFALARAALRPWAGNIVWVDALTSTYSNAQLIALADLVVTVNSSVGFEALYFDKVVSVLGEAVYKPAGLFPSLDEAITRDFDRESYLEGIGLLRRFMLGGYLAPADIRGNFAQFESTVLTVDAARRNYGENAMRVAQAMYRSLSVNRQHQARRRMVSGASVPGANEFGAPAPTAAAPAVPAGRGSASTVRGEFIAPARRLLKHTRAEDEAAFRKALITAFAHTTSAEAHVRVAGLVDEKFYLDTYKDVARAGKDPVFHWTRYGVTERRKPNAGVAVSSLGHLVDELVDAAAHILEGGSDLASGLTDAEALRRQDDLVSIRSTLAARSSAVAVVAHLYYVNLVPEILDYLANIPEPFDLIVTMPDWGNRRIRELVLAVFPFAVFYPAVNRGRDIAPFIDVLPILLDRGYDAVLHIQTKAGYFHAGRLRRDLGDLWRREALRALVGSPDRVADIVRTFREDANVNEVGPQPHYLSLTRYGYHDGGALARTLLAKTPADGFFAGTMFWARPAAFAPLVGDGGLDLTSFDNETGANDGALAHLVERLFGHAALRDGGVILGAPIDPALPLDTSLMPLTTTIHEHMEGALASAARSEQISKAALTW
ncbi:rhamnan synthesis F family protein [Microbacterium lacticum]|uniref:rhamnan synthesis F family protein n=1 Tax=Microbacterium lacticum TaxID=33885 RepID=UPI001F57CFF1|nr:rhamnan synthesis F family protein [Microbacterium lacticum]